MPLSFPVETPRDQHGHLKNEMADRVVDKITRYAPHFRDIQIRHITFATYHVNTMFRARRRLLPRPVAPRPDGTEPSRPKGFRDLPIGIDGLYLGGAGCHGGPGITFIPGYNAGYHMLADLGWPRRRTAARTLAIVPPSLEAH